MSDQESINYEKLAEAMKAAEKPSFMEHASAKAKAVGEDLLDADDGSILWLAKKIVEWLGVFTDAISNAISRRLSGDDRQ